MRMAYIHSTDLYRLCQNPALLLLVRRVGYSRVTRERKRFATHTHHLAATTQIWISSRVYHVIVKWLNYITKAHLEHFSLDFLVV